MESNPKTEYQEHVNTFAKEGKQLESVFNHISWARGAFFIVSMVLLVYLANEKSSWVWAIILFFPLIFGLLVSYHNKIKYRRNHAFILSKINQEEVSRIEGNLKGFETGTRFSDALHPYTKDLDVFGQNSLFQLLNRCNSSGSQSLLASWLKLAGTNETILSRQDAIKELGLDIGWQQEFQARGRHFGDEKNNIDALLTWIDDKELSVKSQWLKIALALLPASTILSLIAWGVYEVHYFLPLTILAMNVAVIGSVNKNAKDASEKTYRGNTALQSYGRLIEMIEETHFNSQKLKDLKHFFHHQKFKASSEINKLRVIIDFLQVRKNILYHIVNSLFILDVYWLLRGELWKKKSGPFVRNWFTSLDEIEVINSLAGFHYSNPSYCFPILVPECHTFVANDMGHPLIKSNTRVYNDFSMKGRGEIIIITGSNMAGKSTFLRTVGINVVLALLGAPVCASSLQLANTQIFTSMRTEDNLEENISSFYAELKRLKQLLTLLEKNEPVLFMLDEILKGTNSHDRHLGAVALIKQLHSLNASGFVSTHDIELGKIKNEMDGIENFSFNSEIIDDQIIFDYKLTSGICRNFNASQLMKQMGIKIKDIDVSHVEPNKGIES